MPTPQPGTFAVGSPAHHHLEFRLADDAATAAEHTAIRAALMDLRAQLAHPGAPNVVLGIRPTLWERIAAHRADVPTGAHDYTGTDAGDPQRPSAPATQADIWVWFGAGSPDVCFDAARLAVTALGGVADVSLDLAAYSYHVDRDLTGFEDGTENPPLTDAPGVALCPDGTPGAGATLCLTQKWVHRLDAWEALPVSDQEHVIGRTKVGSIELPDDRNPETSHVRRNVITDANGNERAIFRRNTVFGTATEAGVHFVGFCNDATVLERMLDRMFGVEDGIWDALTTYSTPVTGSWWVVPSLEALAAALDPTASTTPAASGTGPETNADAPSHAPDDGSLAIGDLR